MAPDTGSRGKNGTGSRIWIRNTHDYFCDKNFLVMQACLLVRSKTGQPVTLNSREVLAEVITLSQKSKQPLKG
jgi:hypothetical protein